MKHHAFLLQLVLVSLFIGGLATVDSLGQGTATLIGTVKDPTGAVVVGASIKLFHKPTGSERVAVSNQSGVYTAELLLIGEYRIEASKEGFKTFIQDGLILNTGDRK